VKTNNREGLGWCREREKIDWQETHKLKLDASKKSMVVVVAIAYNNIPFRS